MTIRVAEPGLTDEVRPTTKDTEAAGSSRPQEEGEGSVSASAQERDRGRTVGSAPDSKRAHRLTARALERPARIRFWVLVAGLIALAIVVLVAGPPIPSCPTPVDVTLAGGPEGGVWRPLATAIGALATQRPDYPHLGRVDVEHSVGSRENLRRLLAGEVDVAFLMSSSSLDDNLLQDLLRLEGETEPTPARVEAARPMIGARLRLVAMLHEEVLQVVVRRDRLELGASGLRGARVVVGPAGNGTEPVFRRVLAHLTENPPAEQAVAAGSVAENVAQTNRADLSAADRPLYEPVRMSFNDAPAAFERGEVDAVAIAAGLHADVVAALLARSDAQLLSLGPATQAPTSTLAGVATRHPDLSPRVIPAGTYGRAQPEPVGSLSVRTLLVTRSDVSNEVVEDLTRALFENRSGLIEVHEAAALFDDDPPRKMQRYPWHPGALAYYDRNAPEWFLNYAEVMNLGLAILVALTSGLWAVRQWSRQIRKNRIDVYYVELAALAEQIHDRLSLEELSALGARLQRIRRRAFDELVAEKLDAGPSFLIFQQFLNAELENIDRLRSEIKRTLQTL
mgnify:CR=1 FL=1